MKESNSLSWVTSNHSCEITGFFHHKKAEYEIVQVWVSYSFLVSILVHNFLMMTIVNIFSFLFNPKWSQRQRLSLFVGVTSLCHRSQFIDKTKANLKQGSNRFRKEYCAFKCLTKLLAVDIDPKTRQDEIPKYVHENSVKQRTSINYKEDKAGTKEDKPHMFKQVMSH